MIRALCQEIEIQEQFAKGTEITSVYFGGGTPSLLSGEEIQMLFSALDNMFTRASDIEITLEANPDDINDVSCRMWKNAGINRLSIGIQSIHGSHLSFMKRAHDSEQAKNCIDVALHAGFENLTCDIIYGLPGSTKGELEENLTFLLNKNIPHISAYALTVEEKTLLHHQIKKNISPAPDDTTMEEQFLMLTSLLDTAGFDQYEISNFGKPGYYAVHNTRYWKGDTYLGVGPSAHSFTGDSRRWNIANNAIYMKSVFDGKIPFEEEILTTKDKFNEYVMTGLRTLWGVDAKNIRSFGLDFEKHFRANIEPFMRKGLIIYNDPVWKLSQQGKLFADNIASSLFVV